MRAILVIVGVVILGFIALFALGIFGEAADVAHDEFGPRAALEKYEWFKEQAAFVDKADQDITIFKARIEEVKTRYRADYGNDVGSWPVDIRTTYNHELRTVNDDLAAVVANRNGVVRDYNAQSSKFNWSLFETNSDVPPKRYDELNL